MPAKPKCPTPSKRRHATRGAAVSAAYGAQVGVGLVMTPYLCGCSWWHLTKQATNPAPAQPGPVAVADQPTPKENQ